tara:strand:+ start:837 stop:1883 length:1047 start_codon:yes stop_codon:yes gene_type:complete
MSEKPVKVVQNVVLEDPLAEKALPQFALKLKINHHSPTQFAICDAAWIYKYLVLDQKQRRELLLANSQMKAGVCVNEILQHFYAKTIWKLNPQTHKLHPVKNDFYKKQKIELINKFIDDFKNYDPIDEKDRQKKEKYLDEINSVVVNGFTALDNLLENNLVLCEEQISINQEQSGLLLPTVGRTDFRFGDADSEKVNDSLSRTKGIIELKTIWSKAGKLKVNGDRSFIKAKIPTNPSFNHLVQCATYAAKYNFDVPIHLLYLTKDEYKIFDSNNCQDLTKAGLIKCFKILCNTFKRREKILGTFEEFDKDKIIKAATQVVDPNFDHPFAWSNLPQELLTDAKELWDCA